MIYLKTKRQIELMKEACRITKGMLDIVEKNIKPGVSTLELDQIAEDYCRSQGAIPNFKGYGGFPGSICTSINDVIVHGIPKANVILKEGDIISIDCGAYIRGFNGDAARTFPVGKISKEKQQLIDVTKQSFFEGIKGLKVGDKIGDIGERVQKYAESFGFSVVREMVGHGIGRELHEDPEVPNYGHKGFGPTIENGLCIAVEPMINMGKKEIVIDKDGWTTRTKDGKPSAHYENTLAITDEGVEILTL
ncbi:MAG TPA: type I methionyl aminopeptidase [Clostridiales bacterium]|nr:type I methionyl aminopeptidase [Clostridiales bacterium]